MVQRIRRQIEQKWGLRIPLPQPPVCPEVSPIISVDIHTNTPSRNSTHDPGFKLGVNPFSCQNLFHKPQFILSYAFSKSILKITPHSFRARSSCMISCSITAPSRMYLPFMKADCHLLTSFPATTVSLSKRNFVKILKLTFKR